MLSITRISLKSTLRSTLDLSAVNDPKNNHSLSSTKTAPLRRPSCFDFEVSYDLVSHQKGLLLLKNNNHFGNLYKAFVVTHYRHLIKIKGGCQVLCGWQPQKNYLESAKGLSISPCSRNLLQKPLHCRQSHCWFRGGALFLWVLRFLSFVSHFGLLKILLP